MYFDGDSSVGHRCIGVVLYNCLKTIANVLNIRFARTFWDVLKDNGDAQAIFCLGRSEKLGASIFHDTPSLQYYFLQTI